MRESASIGFGKPCLLIVDQSKIMRRALIKVLGREYDLIEASDAEQAWSELQSGRVQAVLMGLDLNDLRGYGLLERIRDARLATLRHTPVAVVADDSREERERAEHFGASAFVAKPFDADHLKALTRTLVESAGQIYDPDAREREEREAGMVDPLTALPNRSYFFYRGPKELSFAQRHGKEMAVVLVQMDNLEYLVEDHGRAVVKQLLKKLAKYVQAAVRTEDTVARVGARRFAVIAPTTSDTGARELGERVLSKVRSTVFNYGDQRVSFTVSIGVAAPEVHSMATFDEIVDLAAQRLDMAVWSGANRLVAGEERPAGDEPASDEPAGAQAQDAEAEQAPAPAAPEPEETSLYTNIHPAVGDSVDTETPAANDGLPEEVAAARKGAAPALEAAMWLLESGQSEKLQPHYRLLLEEILPLLEHANSAMKLDIEDALAKLRAKIR